MKTKDKKIVLSEGARNLLERLLRDASDCGNQNGFYADPVTKEQRGWLTELKRKKVLISSVDKGRDGAPDFLDVEMLPAGLDYIWENFKVKLTDW